MCLDRFGFENYYRIAIESAGSRGVVTFREIFDNREPVGGVHSIDTDIFLVDNERDC